MKTRSEGGYKAGILLIVLCLGVLCTPSLAGEASAEVPRNYLESDLR